MASARIGAQYVFNSPIFENIIYKDVSTKVDGSICVIRKNRIIAFFARKRNLARPYDAGMDKTVEIMVAPTAMIVLFLNPRSVSLDAESCALNASRERFLGHNGVGISKISTCVFNAVTTIQYRGNIKITKIMNPHLLV